MVVSAEIKYSMGFRFNKGGQEITVGSGLRNKDVAGENHVDITLGLTTSWEAIPKGEIATVGTLIVENLGNVAVELRESLTGDPRLVVKPGQIERFHLSNTGFATPAARAATSTTRARFILIED